MLNCSVGELILLALINMYVSRSKVISFNCSLTYLVSETVAKIDKYGIFMFRHHKLFSMHCFQLHLIKNINALH